MADIDPANLLLFDACCCCFDALYTDFPGCIGCSDKKECLCIEYALCCKLGTDPYPVTLATGNGYICKLSLYCCEYALKIPSICCKCKGQCFCCVNQSAFPTDDDVSLMCAICFVALYPSCGILKKVSEVKK